VTYLPDATAASNKVPMSEKWKRQEKGEMEETEKGKKKKRREEILSSVSYPQQSYSATSRRIDSSSGTYTLKFSFKRTIKLKRKKEKSVPRGECSGAGSRVCDDVARGLCVVLADEVLVEGERSAIHNTLRLRQRDNNKERINKERKKIGS
jgi:hypothetical protein